MAVEVDPPTRSSAWAVQSLTTVTKRIRGEGTACTRVEAPLVNLCPGHRERRGSNLVVQLCGGRSSMSGPCDTKIEICVPDDDGEVRTRAPKDQNLNLAP